MKIYILIGAVILILAVIIITTVRSGTNGDPYDTLAAVSEGENQLSPDGANSTTEPINNIDNKKQMTQATLRTNMGDIVIEFFPDVAPNTVSNFTKLASEGFYNNVKFHRVIEGFMIQGGDPTSKDDTKAALWGTGGPGYKFADEINTNSPVYKTGYKRGIVAMANSGPNTNGSQFFIMHADYPLPPLYTIFGKVTAGQEVVDKIAAVETNEQDRPLAPIVIESVSLK